MVKELIQDRYKVSMMHFAEFAVPFYLVEGLFEKASETSDLARSVDGSEGVFFIPGFQGIQVSRFVRQNFKL